MNIEYRKGANEIPFKDVATGVLFSLHDACYIAGSHGGPYGYRRATDVSTGLTLTVGHNTAVTIHPNAVVVVQ